MARTIRVAREEREMEEGKTLQSQKVRIWFRRLASTDDSGITAVEPG
jgi:hypothetical protein